MITIQKLKGMKSNEIFATGINTIIHPWFNSNPANLTDEDGKLDKNGKYTIVKWVAIRGKIHDWAIYHSLDANIDRSDYLGGAEHLLASDDFIARVGAKLRDEKFIKKFVPCDNEAFAMYRY